MYSKCIETLLYIIYMCGHVFYIHVVYTYPHMYSTCI